jgi:transposase
MSKRTAPVIAVASDDLNICCDVGMDQIHVLCPPTAGSGFARVVPIANRSDAIRAMLEQLRQSEGPSNAARLRIVVEPTGLYHQLLTRIARDMGFRTALVNAEHVVKMRTVVFGDSGKTDRRDPHAIAAVADRGRIIIDRVLPEVFQLLRGWSSIYQVAENGLIDAKGSVHRALKVLFPDFDFSSDFVYSASGQAIMSCYEFDPHRIAAESPSRMLHRLQRRSGILRSSVCRLLQQARSSARTTPNGALRELALEYLRLAWQDYKAQFDRRELARKKLQALYERARGDDPRLPAPVARVITACGLARLFAELGPLSDFRSWRQVYRLAGLNLRERQSGRYVGQIKITHKGRPQLRRVAMQLVLPLVRKAELFGAYYAQKSNVQKMPGPKAMTAVARKFLKMIWGWYHSESAFDATRVFRPHPPECNAA